MVVYRRRSLEGVIVGGLAGTVFRSDRDGPRAVRLRSSRRLSRAGGYRSTVGIAGCLRSRHCSATLGSPWVRSHRGRPCSAICTTLARCRHTRRRLHVPVRRTVRRRATARAPRHLRVSVLREPQIVACLSAWLRPGDASVHVGCDRGGDSGTENVALMPERDVEPEGRRSIPPDAAGTVGVPGDRAAGRGGSRRATLDRGPRVQHPRGSPHGRAERGAAHRPVHVHRRRPAVAGPAVGRTAPSVARTGGRLGAWRPSSASSGHLAGLSLLP
jgi:hypothetical protein